MFGSEEEIVQVNGIELSVIQAGLKHERSMVMVHGLGYDKESMLPLFEHYRHTCHVVSYDTRGSGRSSKPLGWTLDDSADDLRGLVVALGLEKPVCIGFSMGSFIVLRAAERYPELFSKIVLIGTSGKDPSSYDEVGEGNEGASDRKEAPHEQVLKKIKSTMEHPKGIGEELLDTAKIAEKMIKGHEAHPLQAAELIERTHPSIELSAEQFEALQHSYAGFDNLKDADKVEIPVLCLTGDHDHANPPERGRAVAQAVKNGRFYEIPRSGHVAMYENLPDVVRRIDEFLRDGETSEHV